MTLAVDPVELARALIRRPSVTPADAGALDVLQEVLQRLGFTCRRMPFGEVDNLYARRGTGPNLCFAGHTDVVPPGDHAAWTHPPFAAEIAEDRLYGRGAVDMKGGIAAFTAAAATRPNASLSLLITGDEEGPALDGTRRVVQALQAEGERIDHCLVGEPTSTQRLGDMIKVGRRGTLSAWITAEGRQGHVAYPERAANPIPAVVRLLDRLQSRRLDEGSLGFLLDLEVTSVDVGNPAGNVIPARASARLNIRFNPTHSGAALEAWLREEADAASTGEVSVTLEAACSGEAFLTERSAFTDLVRDAVESVTGLRPEASTSGGTSDARFIRAMCPVVELGLVGATIHQVDEHVDTQDLRRLQRVYEAVIDRYVAAFGG